MSPPCMHRSKQTLEAGHLNPSASTTSIPILLGRSRRNMCNTGCARLTQGALSKIKNLHRVQWLVIICFATNDLGVKDWLAWLAAVEILDTTCNTETLPSVQILLCLRRMRAKLPSTFHSSRQPHSGSCSFTPLLVPGLWRQTLSPGCRHRRQLRPGAVLQIVACCPNDFPIQIWSTAT